MLNVALLMTALVTMTPNVVPDHYTQPSLPDSIGQSREELVSPVKPENDKQELLSVNINNEIASPYL